MSGDNDREPLWSRVLDGIVGTCIFLAVLGLVWLVCLALWLDVIEPLCRKIEKSGLPRRLHGWFMALVGRVAGIRARVGFAFFWLSVVALDAGLAWAMGFSVAGAVLAGLLVVVVGAALVDDGVRTLLARPKRWEGGAVPDRADGRSPAGRVMRNRWMDDRLRRLADNAPSADLSLSPIFQIWLPASTLLVLGLLAVGAWNAAVSFMLPGWRELEARADRCVQETARRAPAPADCEERDPAKLRDLAESNPEASFRYGLELLKKGTGADSAIPHVRRAAERGFVPAMLFMGDCHAKGCGSWGFTKDAASGFAWYRRAAEVGGGSPAALRSMGYMLYAGVGVPKDVSAGTRHLIEAADLGDDWAQVLCFVIAMQDRKDSRRLLPAARERCVNWLVCSALKGNPYAALIYSEILGRGELVRKDAKRARHWFARCREGIGKTPPAIGVVPEVSVKDRLFGSSVTFSFQD